MQTSAPRNIFTEAEWTSIKALFEKSELGVLAGAVSAARENMADGDYNFYRDMIEDDGKCCPADLEEAHDFMALYSRLCDLEKMIAGKRRALSAGAQPQTTE